MKYVRELEPYNITQDTYNEYTKLNQADYDKRRKGLMSWGEYKVREFPRLAAMNKRDEISNSNTSIEHSNNILKNIDTDKSKLMQFVPRMVAKHRFKKNKHLLLPRDVSYVKKALGFSYNEVNMDNFEQVKLGALQNYLNFCEFSGRDDIREVADGFGSDSVKRANKQLFESYKSGRKPLRRTAAYMSRLHKLAAAKRAGEKFRNKIDSLTK